MEVRVAGRLRGWLTPAYLAGMVLVFVGERVVGAPGKARWLIDAMGIALAAMALGARVSLRRAAAKDTDRRAVEGWIVAAYGLGLVAIALHAIGTDVAEPLLRRLVSATQARDRLRGVLLALWPLLWTGAMLPLVLMETAYASMARADAVELRRVRSAALAGLTLACAIGYLFGVNYIADARDKSWDLSYLKTTRPGSATKNLVRALPNDVKAVLFFPNPNDVREDVRGYFRELSRAGRRLKVETRDHAMSPALAREYAVNGNGWIVLVRGAQREKLEVGVERSAARGKLAKLDGDVQKLLYRLSRPERVAYFTTGHEERDYSPGADDRRGGLRNLRVLLESHRFSIKRLGMAEGLGAEVPQDAVIVFVLGPDKPFLPEEAATLVRYVHGGGRLVVALPPAAGLDHAEILRPLGLRFDPRLLANDRAYARRAATAEPSDRHNLVTNRYSSHPSVSTLSRNFERAITVLLGAGSLERLDAGPAPAKQPSPPDASRPDVTFVLRSLNDTWRDLDGNHRFDAPAEQKKIWDIGAAITVRDAGKEGRAVVLGAAEVFTDDLLDNPGNALLALDAVKWLAGEENLAGETSSERDVPIRHTRESDVVWFYATTLAVPALLLGAGIFFTTGRRARPRKGKETA